MKQVDSILLDIVMPKKDGIQALREIRRTNSAVYITIVSSVGTQSNLMKAIKLGANDFLQKPVRADAILGIAQKIAHGRGGA